MQETFGETQNNRRDLVIRAASAIPDHAFVRNLVYTWNHVSSCELSLV